MTGHVLAIDQGTTSTRAIVFDPEIRIAGVSQQELPQLYPHSGWVEHDPEAIWSSTVQTMRGALQAAGIGPEKLAGIGLTNQRETVVVWERASGRAIHNAIVWQDRRTSSLCERLVGEGHEPLVTDRTGLIIDPYFSGTKLAWILDNVEGAREAAARGELLAGTVDSFLIWRLTGGKMHVTDATNASRTMLCNIESGTWDEALLDLLDVPANILPRILDCADDYGATESSILGISVPILGVAGDQQAATIGQACFSPGMMKSTYGTGCFALLNTGKERVRSQSRLLSTVAYRLDGQSTYALEGSIFVAGAAVQWLRDGLGILSHASQSGALAERADDGQAVILVPAFTGLGAPHWDPEARGAIFGLTRNTGPAELARAALESVAFQTMDLLEAMRRDWPTMADAVLRVDGGMTASDWTMQRLADLLGAPVDRPVIQETTALGVAWLAGMRSGAWPGMEEFSRHWQLERTFKPQMTESVREGRVSLWRDAVRRTLTST